MLPGFFIVGAAKSGTTSLYHYLDRHPEVYMSPIKEPNHFCTDIRPDDFTAEFVRHEKQKNLNLREYLDGPMLEKHWGYFVTNREDYEKLFKNRRNEKVAGEVSNSYLYSEKASANIHREIPDAKIIIMLRNPADRAYSHYLANLRDGRTFRSFRSELEHDRKKFPKGWGRSCLYIEMGFYYEQVERYKDLFPPAQLRIYLFDDFKQNTGGVMKDLCEFLGITITSGKEYEKIHNEAMEPVSSRFLYTLSRTGLKKKVFRLLPAHFREKVKNLFFRKGKPVPLSVADRAYLNGIYREDIIRLGKLINRDLGQWLD